MPQVNVFMLCVNCVNLSIVTTGVVFIYSLFNFMVSRDQISPSWSGIRSSKYLFYIS